MAVFKRRIRKDAFVGNHGESYCHLFARIYGQFLEKTRRIISLVHYQYTICRYSHYVNHIQR